MATLKIKDTTGSIYKIPCLRGADGKSAYEFAKDGGYTGTEGEFAANLAAMHNGVIQHDWSQNDEKQPDYIKNRTHWTDYRKGTAIIEDVIFPLTNGQCTMEVGSLAITVGTQLYIVYNGVEYQCIGQDGSGLGYPGSVAAGNIDAVAGTGDNGMPFVVGYLDGMFLVADVYNQEATSCTISAYYAEKVIHKLDNEYIDAEWMAVTKYGKGAVILEETTVTGTINETTSGNVYVSNISASRMDLGKHYIVTFNGVEYVCEYKVDDPNLESAEQTMALGNFGLVNIGADTGEPFLVIGNVALGWNLTIGDTVTVSIHEAVMTANPLPEKFIPDTIARVSDIPSISNVPTKVSQLENDAGFITSADVPEAADVPTKVSQLENDSNYAIVDAIPTDAHINALIDAKLAAIPYAEDGEF